VDELSDQDLNDLYADIETEIEQMSLRMSLDLAALLERTKRLEARSFGRTLAEILDLPEA
jgi:hypothetical protein